MINIHMDNIDNPNEEDKNLKKELDKITNSNKKVNIRKKSKNLSQKERKKFANAINNRLSEFCDAYILFAFDVNGASQIVINIENNLEKRGITDLLMEYIQNNLSASMIIGQQDDGDNDTDDDDLFQ